jgi:hypothetical protein
VRERFTTLVCALGALLLFATLFVRGGGLERRAALPTTVEHGGNGLRGALLWLQSEGIRTLSLRERFDTLLTRGDLRPAGNLLIVTLPAATPLRLTEAAALERWVSLGNTLLVVAALSDRPDWGVDGVVHSDLSLLTGLEFVPRGTPARGESPPTREPAAGSPTPGARGSGAARREDEKSRALARALQTTQQPEAPVPSVLVPNRSHAYLNGVSAARALSDYPPRTWDVLVPQSGFALSLAHDRKTGAGVLWVRPAGAGTIIVSAFGSLFTNRALALADNARLLANMVQASLGAGGAVLFDDEHQGLTTAYDPAKFYLDPRLYATLGLLVAVWLVWVLGGTRLRLPQVRLPAPREAELVRATGLFLARVLRPAAAARRMLEQFFARLRARTRHGGDGPPWDWLEHHPRLSRSEVQQLKYWYADSYSDRRVPLLRLYNLIVTMERRLAA